VNTRLLSRLIVAGALCALTGFVGSAHAALATFGPTPYLSFADSPFSGGSFSYFHLENFEDHLLNTPGVSGSPGGVTSVVFGPSIHDSVDADDGVINGSGLLGDSWFTSNGAAGVTFTFSAAILGSLPTSAGLVWTDGGTNTPVTFTVFGENGQQVFTTTLSGFADGSNNGETAEDRFFGATYSGGISSIFMSNASGGMEVDHLQYGLAAAGSVPEPETYAMLLAGLGLKGFAARRRQNKHA
jgi:hypothetical protein